MTVASEAQRKTLAPLVAYFDRKSSLREEKHVADTRFVASVQEVMRAEGRDQLDWAARRRRRCATAATINSSPTNRASPRGRVGDFPNPPSEQRGVVGSTTSTPVRAHNSPIYANKDAPLKPVQKGGGGGPGGESTPTEKGTSSTTPPLPRQHQHRQQQQQQQQQQHHQQHQQRERPPNSFPKPGVGKKQQPRKRKPVGCRRQQPGNTDAATRTRTRSGNTTTTATEDGPDLTQALTRVSKLKATLARAPDPPEVAAEMAALHLALSDHRAALASFRLAMKPSPEPVPTKEDVEKKERQDRKLMLMDAGRRAEALAQFREEEARKKLEREIAENARRKEAATGVFKCLLELKQPVAAAGAAKARLAACETPEERRQVQAEIHEALLECEGLVEPEATNQGAWLTESAGALADLHASVLEALTGSTSEPSASPYIDSSERQHDRQSSSSLKDERATREGTGSVNCCGRFEQGGNSETEGGGGHDVAGAVARVAPGRGIGDAGESGGGRPSTVIVADDRSHADQQRRTRLNHLGRLLARRRQFTASRQAFDDAIRGGPDEKGLRERNKAYTSGFFLDMCLEEASPTIRLDLESRWQGGVEADETRRLALDNYTGFTGAHSGAGTLVAVVPGEGLAADASGIAYAERFSRTRVAAVHPLQAVTRGVGGGAEEGATTAAAAAAAAVGRATGQSISTREQFISGLMLGHRVPAKDMINS